MKTLPMGVPAKIGKVGLLTALTKMAVMTAVMGLGMAAAPAAAGVIMVQQTVTNSMGGSMTSERTVMIQGKREKMLLGHGQTLIIDLDAGKMLVLNGKEHSYRQMPFPPKGAMAQMMQGLGTFEADFKKIGVSKTMLGYKCLEYTGASKTAMGEYSMTGCFSTEAPGADDYTTFARTMMSQFKAGRHGPMGPAGLPLQMDSSARITSLPGIPSAQAEMFKRMMANRPPTTSTTVTTSVKSAELPSGTFAVPAGYVEQQMPNVGQMHGMGGGGMGGPAAAPTPYQGE